MTDTDGRSISYSSNWQEMADFWDSHSLADFESETHEVDVTFDSAARRSVVQVEPELMADLVRIASERRVSVQTLVNVWLRQRVDNLGSEAAS
jgi:hypothetical protein